VQHRATKYIRRMKNKSCEERLQQLGLTTLKTRRIRGDMIETFTLLTGKEGVDRDNYFQVRKV